MHATKTWDEYARALPPIPFAALSPAKVTRLEAMYLEERPDALPDISPRSPSRLINLGFLLNAEEIIDCAIRTGLLRTETFQKEQPVAPWSRKEANPKGLNHYLVMKLNHALGYKGVLGFANCTPLLYHGALIAVHPKDSQWSEIAEATLSKLLEEVKGVFKKVIGLETELAWHLWASEFAPQLFVVFVFPSSQDTDTNSQGIPFATFR